MNVSESEEIEQSCTSEEELMPTENEICSKGDFQDNPQWADAMSKILKIKKPKKKKTIVLSKAKRITQLKNDDMTDNENGSELSEDSDTKQNIKRKLWLSKGRKKPNILQKNREKELSKIALKGVVQLFNAVDFHKKKIEKNSEKVCSSETIPEKIVRNTGTKSFLHMLKEQIGPQVKKTNNKSSENSVKSENNTNDTEGEQWEVLKDNFMLNSSLKNWDKSLDVHNV